MLKSSFDYKGVTEVIRNADIAKIQDSLNGLDLESIDKQIVSSTGISFLNSVVEEILQPYSSKYFFEYALLPSSLDPEKEKLYSMSVIQEDKNDPPGQFKDAIELHVKNIIENLYKKHEENFFHNPETFLAPSEINIEHSFSDELGLVVVDRNAAKLKVYTELVERHLEVPNTYYPAGPDLYFSNMTYQRKFDHIISSAKIIYDDNQGDPARLQQHYKNGAVDLRYFYDQYIKAKLESACYITMPIISSSAEGFPQIYRQVFGSELDGKLQGIGVFFIYFIARSDEALKKLKQPQVIEQLKQQLFIEVNNVIRTLTYNHVFNIGLRLYEKAKENSIKSAIAAIMARNMSHNLGSHVFYYTRNEIDRLTLNGGKDSETFKGLSYFLQYVQERQDFIATITSQEPQAFGPFNLKANVFDLITPDAHEHRHRSIPPPTNFLLKYITYSEGLTRTHDDQAYANIEIILKKDRHEFSSWPPKLAAARKTYDEHIGMFYDIDCSVKGGQNSSHAFLIIIENMIRNAAKHGRKSFSRENLNMTIEVIKRDEEYEIQLYDNCGNGATAATHLNEQLKNLSIINEQDAGSINRESKGIKEIIVCIGWLKGLTYSDIFNDGSAGVKPNVVSITNKTGNLCYSFTLPCYHNAVVVSDPDKVISDIKCRRHNSFASFYICESAKDFQQLKRYVPRCLLANQSDVDKKNLWEQYFEQDQRFKGMESPAAGMSIFFERDKSTPRGNFIFCENQEELQQKVEACRKPYLIFKNHLSKNKQAIREYFLRFEEQLPEDVLRNRFSVESISGGNYSFNLLQRAKQKPTGGGSFDQELYYRILEAYATQIVLIDERLCSEKTTMETLRLELLQRLALPERSSIGILNRYLYKDVIAYSEIIDRLDNAAAINAQLEQKKFRNAIREEIRDDISALENKLFKLKNIFLFNLDPQRIELVDYEGKHWGREAFSAQQIVPKFLSIHIGILDKLHKDTILNDQYYPFEPTVSRIGKISILEKLRYLKYKLHIPDETYIAVHSGRGGLNESEQGITFIPFTSLQSSFENCKYVLSDLFHNQVYFPIT